MDEVIKEFVLESREALDRADQDIILLERDPENRKTLRAIFRTVHTIKGTCGFLGFTNLEALTHTAEHLLGRVRDGRLKLTPEMTSTLLTLIDTTRRALDTIERTGSEGASDFESLRAALKRLRDSAPGSPAEEACGAKPIVHEPNGAAEAPIGEPAPPNRPQRGHDELATNEGPDASIGDSSIRVGVGLLDAVMNLVGEMVLVRNQLLQKRSNQEDPAFQRLNHFTTDLQESVMRMRMQPISSVWTRFPRMVRDLALSCGKQAQLNLEGQDTELDKSLLEAIKDPLAHLLRNAIDHGIEAPELRVASGKSDHGRITLRAYHEEGQVIIEVSDDGGGIDPEHLRDHAVDMGHISRAQAAAMSRNELLNLIFLPGFSTARAVTNVSGRGVGMDVVKTNIETIGGTIEIDSTLGQRTVVRIRIPLTLAIIPALIVCVDGDRFAIPQASLHELVQLTPDEAQDAIERIQGVPLYRLRGNLLPLVFLDEQLELRAARVDGKPLDDDGLRIVIVTVSDRRFGLVVDEIRDTEEIVVKPLGKELSGIREYAGATIMGDGTVALILDIAHIAQRAHVTTDLGQHALPQPTETPSVNDDRQPLLLFRITESGMMAIPTAVVARLEEFPPSRVEHVGPQEVVQYRDDILPLIYLSKLLPERRGTSRDGHVRVAQEGHPEAMKVVVCTRDDGDVGLVVGEIIDIVDETVRVRRDGGRPGVRCSAVVNNCVAEVIDMDQIVQLARASWVTPGS